MLGCIKLLRRTFWPLSHTSSRGFCAGASGAKGIQVLGQASSGTSSCIWERPVRMAAKRCDETFSPRSPNHLPGYLPCTYCSNRTVWTRCPVSHAYTGDVGVLPCRAPYSVCFARLFWMETAVVACRVPQTDPRPSPQRRGQASTQRPPLASEAMCACCAHHFFALLRALQALWEHDGAEASLHAAEHSAPLPPITPHRMAEIESAHGPSLL